MKIRDSRVRRLSLLSKLAPGKTLTESIFVGHGSAIPVREGDNRSVIWRTFVLYPTSNNNVGELLQKTDEFLTTEVGFEFGVILELELDFDAPFEAAFEDEVGDLVTQSLAKILQATIGLDPVVLREPSMRWKKLHQKQKDRREKED